MSPLGSGRGSKNDGSFRQASFLALIPAILIAAPLIGLFIGRWLDGKLGTSPYLEIGGLIIGFASAGREVYFLMKKSQSMDKKDSEDKDKKESGKK